MASTSSPAARGGGVPRPSLAAAGGLAHRAVRYGLVPAVAVVLAACGSSGATTGSGGGSGAAGGGQQAAAGQGTLLSSRTLPGLGAVLVDRSGKTVYSPQEEFGGTIKCKGSCLSFWIPVKAGTTLSAPGGLPGKLGKLHRSDDGLTQLTYNGKPLYTFVLDKAPGQAHGNNYRDSFGGVSFTWHALTTSGSPAKQSQSGSSGGSGGYGYGGGGGSGY
jgi:predicted lipoprotein with Yx(FWY)xxD motif